MTGWQDEAGVVRTVAFVVVRQVLALIGLGQTPDVKDVEIAVLRHQLIRPRRPATSGSTPSPLRAGRPNCCRHARNWRGAGWIRPGHYGSCGCWPACPSDE